MSGRTEDFLENFRTAVASHDADQVVGTFAVDCHFALPLHPARSFDGREQARTNWRVIFQAVPDLEVRLMSHAHDGDRVWAEWEYTGTRADGTPHHMRGVTIITVDEHSLLTSADFYVEFVDLGEASITEHLTTLSADT